MIKLVPSPGSSVSGQSGNRPGLKDVFSIRPGRALPSILTSESLISGALYTQIVFVERVMKCKMAGLQVCVAAESDPFISGEMAWSSPLPLTTHMKGWSRPPLLAEVGVFAYLRFALECDLKCFCSCQ